MQNSEEFVNPIDPKKVAENPHLLPYAHTVGGFVIKPMDKGRAKGLSIKAMEEQTQMQIKQIQEQIELLAQQARQIQRRVAISEMIYQSDMNFKPLISHIYHLYLRKNEATVLSMIGPDEWGVSGHKFAKYLATVKLLADHTWEILNENQE
jgi:hypothetical protein